MLIRLLYYLPMERMTKVDENIQTAQNMLSGIVERCYELEEENKKLKKENENLKEELFNIKRNTKYNWLRDTLVIDDSKTAIEQGARAYEAELHNRYVSELEEENKKLKSDLSECECSMHFENDEVGYRKRECKKLKEEKEFFYKSAKQFREDAESWRKECERLLGLQICGKTLAERIEDDKKVVRIDTSCMEEDTLQELRDLGEI